MGTNIINGNGMILFTTARKLCGATSLGLLSLVFAIGPSAAEIIPQDRIARWQGNVGVPGGIPARTTIYKNIVGDLGADPTGVVDAAPIIQRAILSCPAGQIVYMPPGTFRLNSNVHVNNKSNVTLRGAGQGQTILKSTNAQGSLYFAGIAPWPPPSNWTPITAGATKGSNTITLTNSSLFKVGMLFSIGPNVLPTWAHNLGGFPDTLRTMQGMFKVRSKTAKTITFDPPLPFDFSGMTPMALASGATTIEGIGLESFTVDLSGSQANWALQFSSAWGCWVSDIEIKHAYTRQALFGEAVRCEVRRCYIHDAQAEGPNHEGLDWGHSSWNLVEDNIFSKAGAMAIIFGDGTGQGLGNVIAYNYVTNTTPSWWDISVNHGPHNMLNLIEGNVIHWYKDDGYFGSSSHNTLLRNVITGQVSLKHFSNYYSIVGNVLGAEPPGKLQKRTYDAGEQSDYWSFGVFPIYELGFPNIGNAHHDGTFIGPTTPPDYHALPNKLDGCQQLDRNVRATLIRHGNYDYVNKTAIWDPNIPDHTIPNSLFYSSKPAWWDADLAWPAIGPDLTPMVGVIPAQKRFQSGATPTPAPSATATSTKAVSPTPTATAVPTSKPTRGGGICSDTIDPSNANSDDLAQDSAYAHYIVIALPAGTVNKLRVYLGEVTADHDAFKIALYDNNSNRLVSATGTVDSIESNSWKEVTVPNTVIRAGTYKIAWASLSGSTSVKYRFQSGNGTTRLCDSVGGFAGFPPNPFNDTSGFNRDGIDAAGACFVSQVPATPTAHSGY